MRYGSVCSGIEAATMGWHKLGWTPSFFSEIEDFPREVLNYHYPNVALHGDFTTIREKQYDPIELLVGGTPCQSFSIAGLRKGLDDDRGNLTLEFVKLADRLRPKWLLWENVPGVLSQDKGKAFGSFLGAMAELGYGFAYRVLDAQYIRTCEFSGAVPQRRRRVFVVGYLGDWRYPAKVLFNTESLQGNPPPSRIKREGSTRTPSQSFNECSGEVAHTLQTTCHDYSRSDGFNMICDISSLNKTKTVCFQQNSRDEVRIIGKDGENAGALTAEPGAKQQNYLCFETKQDPVTYGDKAGPLRSNDMGNAICFTQNDGGRDASNNVAPTLRSGGDGGLPQQAVAYDYKVRRLTPVECERLQGFPDDFTKIPWKGKSIKHCPDSHRYKALGNSMAVNVMNYIGIRINKVNNNEI